MTKIEGKTILITGGAGFIGSHLADESLRRGAKRVILFDNLVNSTKHNIEHLDGNPKVEFVLGDVRDIEAVKKVVEPSDIIFHEAASKLVFSRDRPRIDLETNIIGTFNLLEACRGTEKRMVHASTGSVLGSTDGVEMREEHPQNPTTLYGISKGAGEKYCQFYQREFGVKVTILRYFHVFGPRQDYEGEAGVVSIFLGKVLRGEAPKVNAPGDQIRCFTYVLDDVGANFLVLESDETIGQIYNVASKTRMSISQLADLITKEYAPKLQAESAPARPGEMLRPIPNTSKIEALGFKESVTFQEGLQKTWEWVRDEEQQRHS